MKKTNKLKKIRIIAPTRTGQMLGVSLSSYLKDKWLGVYVSIEESGTSIILASGAQPSALTKKQIRHMSKKLEVLEI